MTSLGPKLHQASLLVCLLLLLLLVQGVKPQTGDPNGNGRSQKEEGASPVVEGEEQLEEQFVASSIGEILQLLTMGPSEEEEAEVEVEAEENTAVRDHLFDLAFCFNLASILVFL
ncbi:LLLL and CFNLAS motif-containing protein 1 [Sarcophilus harrisii]|uniref:LLLL and CFNLAS motif-containing protein 1 n=1 Tax=Sarcophilus harrisii TaxID=9305 RepID=UPI000226E329|nr:LLLL and CFNLAS motif-containing protein 1 [Sarcophilus harrisii]